LAEEALTGGAGVKSAEGTRSWEKRLEGETAKAFIAFSMYRSMGFRRSIKGCMELHGIESGRYGSWSRWSRLYRWAERAAEYDEFSAEETRKQILAEHVERQKHIMDMLGKVDSLVNKRLDTLNPEDLDADRAMDLLERSAKLDGYVSGSDSEKVEKKSGQLEINFVDSFSGM
jgi:hypothetical protein